MAFHSGMVELANRPYRQRRDPEVDSARKREKERMRLDTWGAQTKYYERCEKQNAKFEQFTSPRYYAENNRLHEEMRTKKERVERLDKRREKLRKLFADEARTLELEELMVKCTPRSWEDVKEDHRGDQVPIELLKKVNDDYKREEEAKRRHRAETGLYDQWKRNSAPLRDAERRCNLDKVKMSWLDQQIQKRMQKEREEEEARQYIELTKKAIEGHRRDEEEFKREAERKRDALRADLLQQMEQIAKIEEQSAKLRQEEEAVRSKGAELRALEDKWEEAERRRRTEEIALENQRFHKQKLELKAKQDARQLDEDRRLIERIREAELCDKVSSEKKRAEIQRSMNEFLALVNALKEAEEKRLHRMQLAFPSEAPKVFREFDAAWKQEETMRKDLAHGILQGLRAQIEENLERSRAAQKALLEEREEMLDRIRKQKEEIDDVKKWEEKKKEEYRKCLDQQVACKRARERTLKEIEQGKREEEWEKLRSEEARLKDEIMRMQRGQAVQTYGRRRFFY